jgi:hypothetical protein
MYNATLWPNLQVPAAINDGKVGGTPAPPPIKNEQIPAAINDGKIGGTAAPLLIRNEQIPAASAFRLITTPAAPLPNRTTYYRPSTDDFEQTTENQIKTLFKIKPLFDPFYLDPQFPT